MTLDEFRSLCASRRSVRSFSDEPLDRDSVLRLIALAADAPSVQNTQPWHFHILQDQQLKEKFLQSSCYGDFIPGAGAFIVVSCDKHAAPPSGDVLWNPRELEFSCVAAMEHILLGAAAMGIGATWVSLHHGPPHALLHIPAEHAVIGGIMIGHLRPDEKAQPHDRKPLEEVYTIHD